MPISWKISQTIHDMPGPGPEKYVAKIEADLTGVVVAVQFPGEATERQVWVEVSAGSLMVRCYNQENEEPYTVQIDSKDIFSI